MSKIKNIKGQRFGRYLVLEYVYTKNHKAYWMCQCSCPDKTIKTIRGCSLRNGNTRSCGCLQRERASKMNSGKDNGNYKHGLWGTKGYLNAQTQKRKATKLNQTPRGANKDLIQFYYTVAATMADYEVDHYHPLSRGGLHHEENLQLLKRTLNGQKSNKWPLTEEEEIKYGGIKL